MRSIASRDRGVDELRPGNEALRHAAVEGESVVSDEQARRGAEAHRHPRPREPEERGRRDDDGDGVARGRDVERPADQRDREDRREDTQGSRAALEREIESESALRVLQRALVVRQGEADERAPRRDVIAIPGASGARTAWSAPRGP